MLRDRAPSLASSNTEQEVLNPRGTPVRAGLGSRRRCLKSSASKDSPKFTRLEDSESTSTLRMEDVSALTRAHGHSEAPG